MLAGCHIMQSIGHLRNAEADLERPNRCTPTPQPGYSWTN